MNGARRSCVDGRHVNRRNFVDGRCLISGRRFVNDGGVIRGGLSDGWSGNRRRPVDNGRLRHRSFVHRGRMICRRSRMNNGRVIRSWLVSRRRGHRSLGYRYFVDGRPMRRR